MESDNQHAVAELLPKGVASLRNYRWQKGVSGNPRGRPPRGFTTVERCRAAMGEDLVEILRGVVEKAKAMEPWAVKLIMDRCIPAYRVTEKPVTLPGLNNASTPADAVAAVMAALGRGELSPVQASQLLVGLDSAARTLEQDAIQKTAEELKRVKAEEESDNDSDEESDE